MSIDKQIINNLLARPEPPRRICTVVRPLGSGRYQLRDSAQRVFEAEDSTGTAWQVGQGVVVSSGRIVKGGGVVSVPKVFKV